MGIPKTKHFKVFARRESWMASSFEKGEEKRNEHIVSLFHMVQLEVKTNLQCCKRCLILKKLIFFLNVRPIMKKLVFDIHPFSHSFIQLVFFELFYVLRTLLVSEHIKMI